MKHLWLMLTAMGLFLFLGSAGAVETESISLVQLILQLTGGAVLLYLGQRLRSRTASKAKAAARRKAAAAQATKAQRPAISRNHPYHRAA